ncbi:hypothetical protein O181_079366 [Austropuccinia psidii MF-1]|uniref:Integrase zinc-binding domain-containing protein n=1 Tax=Austropuccinia psidii MF-1 TaxID=1389203 RepID=A0A9Q3IDW7_9BASI|nr:hypothetical protein [Austropuccinia psidii MF-1]
MTVVDSSLISFELKELHDHPFSGHLSEDRTREKIKTCIWWPMWQKDVAEYCKTCDRFQKANKCTDKRLGNMINIQEPRRPWETVHMDWVTGLPPGGDRSYNACLYRGLAYSQTSLVTEIPNSPWHYEQILTNYLGQRYPPLQPPTHKLMDCDGFTHDWYILLPSLELEYKTSIHASTNQTPAILEEGWNPKLPQDSLRKDLVEIHPTAASFKGMLEKAKKHAIRCMEDSSAYS